MRKPTVPTTQEAFAVVQSLSLVQLFVTPWTAACQASLSFTVSQSLLKLMSFESVMPSNHLILCCPLLLPSIFPRIRVFSSELALRIVAKVLELQLQHQSFQWIFRGWFPLGLTGWISLQVQGTLNTLLQHRSLKALILLYGSALTSIHDYWKNHSFDSGCLDDG